ncbi:MAG: putative Signal transduction protein containing diguanylate cyclase/phosphodiesterase domain [Firmicutes bacterium]|nr:putative Signal transduction protein containing diguanylate cyclase/phosphodiesterase domain [Bacillota bacterium]
MIQPSKKLILAAMLVMFTLYLVCIMLNNKLWGNILAPVVAFLSSFVIIAARKQVGDRRLYVMLLFLGTAIWGLADLLWLIFENMLSVDPRNIIGILLLYMIPTVFFAFILTNYIFNRLKQWNFKQLLIDCFTFTSLATVVLWGLVFSKAKIELNMNCVLVTVIIFLDVYILISIGLICFSRGFQNINRSSCLVLTGIFIYTVADYSCAYQSLVNAYEPNGIIDAGYMLCHVLVALGVFLEISHPTVITHESSFQLAENLRKPRKSVLLLMLGSYILYLMDNLNLNALLVSIAICILYWIFTISVRSTMLDRIRLKTERDMNEHLERLIAVRTEELNTAYRNLEEISNRDALTGLFNRRYLIHCLDSLIASKETCKFALLYIDANRFKFINDSYGHEMGDKTLHALGGRFLERNLSNCTVFRIGGDEFAVIIEYCHGRAEVEVIAKEILSMIQVPILITTHVFTLTASIGIALYPENALDRDTLMRYADIAMYEVKISNHKNGYLFFDTGLTEKTNQKHELEYLLQNADFDREFALYFQPQYSLGTNALVGMEALLRWQPPGKGMIPPSDFIPIAETNGLIVEIGEWVIDKAFAQIKQWNQASALQMKMSINISPIQIEYAGFMSWFQEKLQKDNINPTWIDLEITEHSAVHFDGEVERKFDQLNELGVSTSIDDFGTGYSSLSYIKRLNIERLKIAKELVDTIEHDENALLIVQAIIMMAQGMKLRTIAEGVEDRNQLEILRELGCDEIQGYLFGKPVPREEFEKQHIYEAAASLV